MHQSIPASHHDDRIARRGHRGGGRDPLGLRTLRSIDPLLVLSILVLAPLGLLVFVLARTAWRMWRGNEEMEPGGSMSRQMFGDSGTSREPRG